MSEPRYDLLVIGGHAPGISVRVERPPVSGETVIGWDLHEPLDGGKGSNQAVAAARLGARVSFVGCVGNDRAGDVAKSLLEAEGVGCDGLRRSADAPTGGGLIMLDGSGVPAMVMTLGANAEVAVDDLTRALDRQGTPRVLLSQMEVPEHVVLESLRRAKELGSTTVLNVAPVPPDFTVSHHLGELVDVLVPNEFEAKSLLGLDAEATVPPGELAHRLREATQVACVVVTAGERGFVGVDREGSWSVPSTPVDTVDTSGAGDVFCAALAVQLSGGDPARPASRWAGRAATLSVTGQGTIPSFPTREQVDAFQEHVKHPGLLSP